MELIVFRYTCVPTKSPTGSFVHVRIAVVTPAWMLARAGGFGAWLSRVVVCVSVSLHAENPAFESFVRTRTYTSKFPFTGIRNPGIVVVPDATFRCPSPVPTSYVYPDVSGDTDASQLPIR